MSGPPAEHLDLEHRGPVRVILWNRPDRRNALTPAMLAAARDAVARPGEARALVLAGRGPAFCAGFDLSLCRDHPDGRVTRALLEGLSALILALRQSPVPVVLAAHAAAIAGGCALLGGADLVVTDELARLGYPAVRLGISPAVSAPFLQSTIGPGPARPPLLDTRLLTGREAFRLGLAHELVASPADVLPRAVALAESLAAKPAPALLATRRWLDEITAHDAQRLSRTAPPIDDPARRALDASLALTGGEEERRLLPQAWTNA